MERKRILIIRFSSLGDVVLTAPVINKLAQSGYQVDMLTKKKYEEILKYNPGLNKILVLENFRNLFQLVKVIRMNNYYRICDLHKNLRTAFIKLFFFHKTITYKKYRIRRLLLLYFKINFLRNNSVITNYLKVLSKLGITIRERDTAYKIKVPMQKEIKKILKKNMITIAPFARHGTKEWPYYQELIEQLSKKYPVSIIGERKDYMRAQKFSIKNTANLCGRLDMAGIVTLINRSKLLITNDSGLMHIGAGTNTPVIVLLGSTVREFGFMPQRKNIIIMENNKLICRPCDFHGEKSCPRGHFKCMKDISTGAVLTNAGKFIKI